MSYNLTKFSKEISQAIKNAMKTNDHSASGFYKEIKRLFSGMLLGSLFLLISAARLNGQCSITLTSAAGSDNQTVCINTAITNITYATIEATGADFSGLPAGVTGDWSENVVKPNIVVVVVEEREARD